MVTLLVMWDWNWNRLLHLLSWNYSERPGNFKNSGRVSSPERGSCRQGARYGDGVYCSGYSSILQTTSTRTPEPSPELSLWQGLVPSASNPRSDENACMSEAEGIHTSGHTPGLGTEYGGT